MVPECKWSPTLQLRHFLTKGAFKYYVIKEVGGWGQKMAIFDDLQYCKSSKIIKSQKHDDVILEWSLSALYLLMIPN